MSFKKMDNPIGLKGDDALSHDQGCGGGRLP